MGLAKATDPEQWISHTNEVNKKLLAGLAYSLDTPSVAEMPELAHQGMQRLLHQMLIRAGKTVELPDIPVPTAEQIASLPLEPHDMPVSPLFTLPAEQAATALPAVTEPYEEHERDEWIRVNAIFDGCPTKKTSQKTTPSRHRPQRTSRPNELVGQQHQLPSSSIHLHHRR